MHKFLKNLTINEIVDSVYFIDYKHSLISKPRISSNGNKYVIFKCKDASLSNFETASIYFYFNNISDIKPFEDGFEGRSCYAKITGRCFSDYPNIKISSSLIIPANEKSRIVFDTSDLFSYSDYYRNKLLSVEGLTNVALRHTSSDAFQDLYDIISIGKKLKFKRVFNSPHDKYQINVFIDDIDEVFNVPAYLTPTMATLIDEGYKFDIIVTDVLPRDESANLNAGMRVTIKGMK
ncbi:MAG: hypothetical protein SPJ52_02995 [Candidatus Enterosoma sp.]|nr:hypothetical protein [bacterium]MDY5866087.1 hypothetical protein [Candidatus Enterosoma sp.]